MNLDCTRRLALSTALLAALVGCHHQPSTWQELAAKNGCTSELLARTAPYDSTRLSTLVGSYRLVQIDTTAGWFELERGYGDAGRASAMRLWAADSLNAHWRKNLFTGKIGPVNRPISGALAGYENAGFSAGNPQIDVTSRALDYLTVRFTPQLMFDGQIWELPIERLGSWGFGGHFEEGSYVVPAGRDGRALGQRAGFYCAFKLRGGE